MKKAFYCLMLILSISETIYAQDSRTTNSDKTFEVSPDYFRLKYFIYLDKGNKMQIDLREIGDLQRLPNPDSILHIFITDIQPLKDSLSDELTAKRIDNITDPAGRKKIRIQQFKPKGSSFFIYKGDVAALKLEQDTVNFMISIPYQSRYTLKNGERYHGTRFARISFFVNQLTELNKYADGSLNKKITLLKKNVNEKWVNEKSANGHLYRVHLKEDSSISAIQPRGYFTSPGIHNFLNLSIGLENYKSYFVPSANVGMIAKISNSFFKQEVGLFWEPNFFFSRNSQGVLQTFRNDFLTATWGHGFIRDNDPRKESNLLAILSYGYLIHRSGDFITRHTSRIGAGRLSLFEGKTKIEPAIYFNDFFKGVTPSIRVLQQF